MGIKDFDILTVLFLNVVLYSESQSQSRMVRMWSKGNPDTLLVGLQIGTTTVENNMEGPQKVKTRTTI